MALSNYVRPPYGMEIILHMNIRKIRRRNQSILFVVMLVMFEAVKFEIVWSVLPRAMA